MQGSRGGHGPPRSCPEGRDDWPAPHGCPVALPRPAPRRAPHFGRESSQPVPRDHAVGGEWSGKAAITPSQPQGRCICFLFKVPVYRQHLCPHRWAGRSTLREATRCHVDSRPWLSAVVRRGHQAPHPTWRLAKFPYSFLSNMYNKFLLRAWHFLPGNITHEVSFFFFKITPVGSYFPSDGRKEGGGGPPSPSHRPLPSMGSWGWGCWEKEGNDCP